MGWSGGRGRGQYLCLMLGRMIVPVTNLMKPSVGTTNLKLNFGAGGDFAFPFLGAVVFFAIVFV